MYDSLASTGKAFSAFDVWYELHKLDFWAWVLVGIMFLTICFLVARK